MKRDAQKGAGSLLKGSLRSPSTWLALAVALAILAATAGISISFWDTIGHTTISGVGWLALGFGVLLTLGLGVGLMSLVFLSNRGGYDELDRDDH